MRTLAAILVETGQPLVLDEIEIPVLKPGQVLVKIDYTGVCHTQVLEIKGYRGKDEFLPHCLGHEGSGTVVDIGQGVHKVKPGDSVILSWMKGSGANVPGTTYEWKGRKVNAGAITTFSQYSVISENRLTPIPPNFPKREAALIGCAIPTGLGAIFNTARPSAGQSLAVFGCGGIGLCALQGAKIAGCVPIIAVDINPTKLLAAKEMGATHVINSAEVSPVDVIKTICPLDFAIEASGNPLAMDLAIKSLRPQGGTAVIIGNARHGQNLSLDPKEFNLGKRILGTWGGDNLPDEHFVRYCTLIQYGRLQLAPFSADVYSLSEINLAVEQLAAGKALRPIIDLSREAPASSQEHLPSEERVTV